MRLPDLRWCREPKTDPVRIRRRRAERDRDAHPVPRRDTLLPRRSALATDGCSSSSRKIRQPPLPSTTTTTTTWISCSPSTTTHQHPARSTNPAGGANTALLEIVSAFVEAGDGKPHRIEVHHVTGNDLEYRLETRFLPRGTCMPSSFLCTASATRLTASEQSCTTEPQPSCTTTQTSVDLPSVGGVDGWEVHATAQEVKNVNNPSSSELALLEARCEDACQDEWNSRPEVSATCTTSGAFTSVTYSAPNSGRDRQRRPTSTGIWREHLHRRVTRLQARNDVLRGVR